MRDDSKSYLSILKFAWGEEPVNYKVSVDLSFQKGKETQNSTLQYHCRMQVMGYMDQTPVIRVEKRSQVLNNKKPDTIIDEITLETAEAINTLEIRLNPKGRITSVVNFEEITNRWERIKDSTSEKYPGEAVEGFLAILEKSLETPDKLLFALKRDSFLSNFFSGIYCNYGIVQKTNDTFISGNLVPGIELTYATEKKWIDLAEEQVEIAELGELQTESVDKEQFIKAVNARTRLNLLNYNSLRGEVESKTILSEATGRIHSHKSSISITADDLKIENILKVTENG